jgi:hypothetical protein
MNTRKHEEKGSSKPIAIANPMYDTVFKRLMENDRVVKFFLSTLLEEQVVEVDIRPQEVTYKTEEPKVPKAGKVRKKTQVEYVGYSVCRMDFMATIQTKEGEHKKILIEVQKSRDVEDLMRFRNYLAQQYTKIDKVNGVKIVLPITTIYFLGFNLPETNCPCIKVDRKYINMKTKKVLDIKASFIENLTHNSYVIQAERITDDDYRTQLDKLLSIFEQANFTEKDSSIGKQYLHQSNDEDINIITSILHEIICDPEERKKLEMEEEAMRIQDNIAGKVEEKVQIIEEKDKTIREKDKALEEKDKTIREKDKTIKEQAKDKKEQDKAIKEQDKALEELRKEIAELKRKQQK